MTTKTSPLENIAIFTTVANFAAKDLINLFLLKEVSAVWQDAISNFTGPWSGIVQNDKNSVIAILLISREEDPLVIKALNRDIIAEDSTDALGIPFILHAALLKSETIFQKIIERIGKEKRIYANQRLPDGMPLLYYASSKGNELAVKRLVNLGADPHSLYTEPGSSSNNIKPMVVVAVNKLDHEAVRLLLKAGANPNEKTSDGVPILFEAALQDDSIVFDRLSKAGANINELDSRRLSVPALAATSNPDAFGRIGMANAKPAQKDNTKIYIPLVPYSQEHMYLLNQLYESRRKTTTKRYLDHSFENYISRTKYMNNSTRSADFSLLSTKLLTKNNLIASSTKQEK